MSSDMVHPRRAASCFKSDMTELSMFKVVFIHITIHRIWLYVKMSDLRSLRETNCRMGISHNQLVVPTSFSSALRTSRFNDIPSLIDFRTTRFSVPSFQTYEKTPPPGPLSHVFTI